MIYTPIHFSGQLFYSFSAIFHILSCRLHRKFSFHLQFSPGRRLVVPYINVRDMQNMRRAIIRYTSFCCCNALASWSSVKLNKPNSIYMQWKWNSQLVSAKKPTHKICYHNICKYDTTFCVRQRDQKWVPANINRKSGKIPYNHSTATIFY